MPQRRISADEALERLREARRDFTRLPPPSRDDDELQWQTFSEAVAAFRKAVRAAVRCGLADHPDVRPVLEQYQQLGDYSGLRAVRLERGARNVGTDMARDDLWLRFHATELVEQGLSLREIRSRLLAAVDTEAAWPEGLDKSRREAVRRRLAGTDQNFHKWMKRSGLI
jgi:hypothetical protein